MVCHSSLFALDLGRLTVKQLVKVTFFVLGLEIR